MQCNHVQHQFFALVTDAVSPEESAELRQHMEQCSACREAFEQFQRIWLKVKDMPQQSPSEHLALNFKTMLHAYRQGLWESSRSSWWDEWREQLGRLLPTPAFRLAFSIALVVIGFGLGVFYSTAHVNRMQVQQLSSELDEMRELVFLNMLKQESSVDRLQGVQWSQDMEHPQPEIREALQRTLQHDPNTNVRLAALRALKPYAHDSEVRRDIVNSFYEQKSPLVQIEIVDFIKQAKDRPVELLHLLEQDDTVHRAVHQHIKWTLSTLEGETLLQENNHAKIRY